MTILKNSIEKRFLLQIQKRDRTWEYCDIRENGRRNKKKGTFEGNKSRVALKKALDGVMKKYSNFDPKCYRVVVRTIVTYDELERAE